MESSLTYTFNFSYDNINDEYKTYVIILKKYKF